MTRDLNNENGSSQETSPSENHTQLQEMNMFASMVANAATASGSGSGNEDSLDIHDDSMDAQHSSSSDNANANDNDKDASANGHGKEMKRRQQQQQQQREHHQEEEEQRRNEISAFAAMAITMTDEDEDEDDFDAGAETNTSTDLANLVYDSAGESDLSHGGSEGDYNARVFSNIQKQDDEWRMNEMNAFSAMANVGERMDSWNTDDDADLDGVVGTGAGIGAVAGADGGTSALSSMKEIHVGDNVDADVHDKKIQQNEMNAFAAMADADMDDKDELLSNIQKQEDERQQSEMNAFAAMANSDMDDKDELLSNIRKQEAKIQQNEMSAFAAMANADMDDKDELLSNIQKQEDERQQSEMNAFAALANSDMDWDPNANANDNRDHNDMKMNGAWNTTNKNKAGGIPTGAGSLVVDMAKMPNAENKNLDAALAMLESEMDADAIHNSDRGKTKLTNGAERATLPPYPSFQAPRTQRRPVFDQIYTEKVMVQRPLFFGTVLPERVQKVIRTGEEDMYPEGPNGPYRPEIHQHLLSPSNQHEDSSLCRNIEGAVEAFGHISFGCGDRGLSGSGSGSGGRGFDFNSLKMNSHVCLYEPVWGDEARLKREDRIRDHLGGGDFEDVAVDNVDASVGANADVDQDNDNRINQDKALNSSSVVSESNSKDARSPVSNNVVSSPAGFIGDAENLFGSPQQEDFSDPSSDLSENLFLQYARGNSHGIGGTFVGATGTLVSVPETDTLRKISDAKGSFEASELKKHIGLNDNLTRALEALVGKEGNSAGTSSASFAMESTEAVAAETIPTVKDGRPLSNLEITMGKVPLYGCDDAPLPNLVDLFIPETKGDQIRSYEQYESEEIISSKALPNIFGPLVCPSRCSGPNDSQSWYSRRNDLDILTNPDAKPHTHHSHRSFDSFPKTRPSGTKSTIPSPLPTPPIKGSNNGRTADSSRYQEAIPSPSDVSQFSGNVSQDPFGDGPVGWWSIDENTPRKKSRAASNATLQAPPNRSKLRPNDYGTLLSPTQDDLLRENRSLSEMHPAVSTVARLPLLSDRPPSTRYIQIDTQVVGFPSLGEIEPFFCSMAVWYVEPMPERGDKGASVEAPLWGRITESLCFDVASEQDEESSQSTLLHPSLSPKEGDQIENISLRSTRCGVFPIQSCYEMKNLYAVLVVQKVLADDSESEIYWSNEADNKAPDVAKYRNKASKAVDRVGHILTPFAFGVAPLAQIMGLESPTIPTSKAAQIPLFKLNSGEGEDPIINHIIAITQPRGRRDGVQAAKVTNGGRAMLVIRNFGYLGIHSAISKKSKLARERLVDFTGEVQVRRKKKDDCCSNRPDKDGGRVNIAKDWHDEFVAEPTINGGRNDATFNDPSLYVQEVAPIPLQIPQPNPRNLRQLKMKSNFYTAISNELVLHPINIENCTKRNITLKLEIARLMYRDDLNALIAIPVKDCIHNCRRGPHLVKESYTACAYHKIDPYFLDEMKIKLPFTKLKSVEHGTLVALFTANHVSVKGKKLWPLKSASNVVDGSSSPMEEIACGFLSLSQGEESACLLGDGMHSVHLKYKAISLRNHPQVTEDNLPQDTKVLEVLSFIQDEKKSNPNRTTSGANEGKPCSIDEFLQNNAVDFHLSPRKSSGGAEFQSAQTSISSLSEIEKHDAFNSKGRKAEKDQRMKSPNNQNLSLNVRTMSLSSIHPQNEALETFFENMPKPPRCLSGDDFSGVWKMKEDQIKKEMDQAKQTFDQMDMPNDRQLLLNTIEISKNSICPQSQIVAHFVRISFQLWRSFVAGSGDPHLAFVNPAMSLPLRLHSFSTLLYVLNQVSSRMTKCDVAETSGSQKFTMSTMSSLVSFLFDEESIFLDSSGSPVEECSDALKSEEEEGTEDEERAPPTDNIEDAKELVVQETVVHQSTNKVTEVSPQKPILNSLSMGAAPSRNPIFQKLDIEFIAKDEVSSTASPKVSPTSTQDDILLKGSAKPTPLRTRSFSAPNENQLKIDTKSDFQFALSAGISPNGVSCPYGAGTPFGPAASRRKWLATGSISLATISEDNDNNVTVDNVGFGRSSLSDNIVNMSATETEETAVNDIDTEIVLHSSKPSKVKQMRVPKVQQPRNNEEVREDKNVDVLEDVNGNDSDSQSSMTIPSMDEIENAGTAFLDSINATYGLGSTMELGGEERRVGLSHHRKTKSRCSIDWTLPPKDLVIESHQQMEILNRNSLPFETNDSNQSTVRAPRSNAEKNTESTMDAKETLSTRLKVDEDDKTDGHNCTGLNKCNACKTDKTVSLPSFMDRLVAQGKKQCQGRWFPYTYEVLIFQWRAVLSEQRKKSTRGTIKGRSSPLISQSLAEAALKARGISISCAPILFAVIKKSLGYRIDSLYRNQQEKSKGTTVCLCAHPLITLDGTLVSAMEDLITMITDACIDSRNFDSWSFRNTSIIVNDSIARFLRDLFAFVDTNIAHRLTLVYFSRFASKEGKQWQDRHSRIGLRCSWEVSKLRLNAVTIFIRFLDYVKINKPLMESWGDWTLKPPTRTNRHLFSDAVEELQSLGMSSFADINPTRKQRVDIPKWKAHWLVEFVTDICLSATGHVEQNIQNRASALLYELLWTSNSFGKVHGSSTVVSSLYLTFIPKLLGHVTHLSSLPPKSQLRKDLLPCFVFVLQSAPFGLLRALWRKLCKHTEGKGATGNYGGIEGVEVTGGNENETDESGTGQSDDSSSTSTSTSTAKSSQCILDLCSLLNLSLTTFEYEGSENNIDTSAHDLLSQWHAEYLLAPENDFYQQRKSNQSTDNEKLTSTSSRKWHSHDAATVIITTCRNIVREYVSMLNLSGKNWSSRSTNGPIASFSNSPIPSAKGRSQNKKLSKGVQETIQFSYEDKVLFLRAIASVYLNCLSLRQSDVVLIKTLLASTEILKVFGIEFFLTAVGETLQHWMRVILVHCGGRRAKVRVEALDFLALILRLHWDTFGSFTRVRVPLLATMTEVMERIVATAAARYYRKQRRQNVASIQYLSNIKAEASLTPLWRTLTRLHDGSASNNAAFKSALQLLANKMRTLYKSYIAAHALAIVNRTNENESRKEHFRDDSVFETTNVVRESGAEFSKKILGYNQVSTDGRGLVTHDEVVENAFFAAANVFSPTELPVYRVVWLRKLAEFHSSRARNAEEAACRLQIHKTLKQAAALHENLWYSKPFWPWVSDVSDGMHLDGEGPAGMGYEQYGTDRAVDGPEVNTSMQDEGSQSFRRIFYRVANSLRMRTGDWDVGGTKTLFYGVTFASEYTSVPSWNALRDIEKEMVEEAEHAGALFLRAGIIESSRFCWGLATQFYSDMFNYLRLAHCYQELARVVASQVPNIDTSNQLELSSPLGRFYRVHFHGGAANEFVSKEFVYRAQVMVKLEEFCKNLKQTFKSIIHEKTDIELVLDDGRPQGTTKRKNKRRQLGAPIGESITIKVTPLKPLLSMDKCPRGSAEWFYQQTEIADFTFPTATVSTSHHANALNGSSRSFRPFSSINSNNNSFGRPTNTHKTFRTLNNKSDNAAEGGEEVGVFKFSYTQPRDRLRGSRDLLKAPNGDVSEKSLRVTELLVPESMPNCVTRQPVTVGNRSVFNQSPLEAGVEAVCSWCAVLFRTAVATNGSAVIGDRADRTDQGIGTAALRVISECIHRSRVKEIGITMLVLKEADDARTLSLYEKLSAEEVTLNQMKLARAIIIFMELLHVLIGRNRDILLNINESRKRRDASSVGSNSARGGLQYGIPPSPGHLSFFDDGFNRTFDDIGSTVDGGSTSRTSVMDRTDKAMAIQRELQLSFVKITKALHPAILSAIRDETPKWMRLCCQDNYFSSGAYKQTRIAIGEELLFFGNPSDANTHDNSEYIESHNSSFGIPLAILPARGSDHGSYAESETSRTPSVASSSRESRSVTYTV